MSAGSGNRSTARTLTNLRGLLRSNLVERAVASSELRWPGSGPMVRLIHEWSELPAPTRRQRLAEIGPEELAKFRFLGAMNPEVERVLSDLETRGIIPPADGVPEPVLDDESVDAVLDQVLPAGGAGTTPTATTQPSQTFEARVVDAVVDYAAEGAQRGAERAEAAYASGDVQAAGTLRDAAAALAQGGNVSPGAAMAVGLAGVGAGGAGVIGRDRFSAERMETRRRAPAESIDLHRETQERMQVALEQATGILDRVRSTVDRHARAPQSSWTSSTWRETKPEPQAEPLIGGGELPPLPELQPLNVPRNIDLADNAAHEQARHRSQESAQREAAEWLGRFGTSQVAVLEAGVNEPSSAALTELARVLRLPTVHVDADRQTRHEVWGGLRRQGRGVEAFAGALPIALAQGSLVVLRGGLPRGQIERIAEGYIDIPGTRASMRVHAQTRLLVLPPAPASTTAGASSAFDFVSALDGMADAAGARRGRR